MTTKKIKQVPLESMTGPNVQRQNEFLDEISRTDPCTLHFFDETSVIRTEGNGRYGISYIGEPAFECQKYASNANFTVNLLHSALRVDHYNILEGPSNGTEMLLFFEDALTLQDPDGSVVLERGDTVVMDNRGFHHGHFAEGMLRDMFDEFGVRLLFQPAYCLHLNTCELCFNQLKGFLRRFPFFAQQANPNCHRRGHFSYHATKLYSLFQALWLLMTFLIDLTFPVVDFQVPKFRGK